MSTSFFTGTEAQLFTGSKAFAAQIGAAYAALGLTEDQAAQYAALDAVWQAAYLAARDPAQRTRGTVQAKNDAKRAVKQMAADLGKIIAGNRAVTDQQRIDLGLSVRSTPSPLPAPGTPTRFRTMLNGDGTLTLTWKCANPPASRGTFYQVWRSIGVGGERVYLGVTGKKRFVDRTLPAGATDLTYHLQAVRTTKAGPWAQFSVSFGVGTSGGNAAATELQPATKRAA